jgi:hypothetical protein
MIGLSAVWPSGNGWRTTRKNPVVLPGFGPVITLVVVTL